MKRIKYCKSCKEYTLKTECPKCGEKTIINVPAKYSLEDKYAKYRRMSVKKNETE